MTSEEWNDLNDLEPPKDRSIRMLIQGEEETFEVIGRVLPESTLESLIDYGIIGWREV